MKNIRIIFYVLLFSLFSISCNSQKKILYNEIKKGISTDCAFLKTQFNLENNCKLFFSNESIPINTTPFYKEIDSISVFSKIDIKDPFEYLNLFDIDNFKETHKVKIPSNLNRDITAFNLKVFCSEEINGVITCEIIESKLKKGSYKSEATFGQSVVFLLEISNNKSIIRKFKKVLQNN